MHPPRPEQHLAKRSEYMRAGRYKNVRTNPITRAAASPLTCDRPPVISLIAVRESVPAIAKPLERPEVTFARPSATNSRSAATSYPFRHGKALCSYHRSAEANQDDACLRPVEDGPHQKESWPASEAIRIPPEQRPMLVTAHFSRVQHGHHCNSPANSDQRARQAGNELSPSRR